MSKSICEGIFIPIAAGLAAYKMHKSLKDSGKSWKDLLTYTKHDMEKEIKKQKKENKHV
jgi:hypothetical protein